MVSIIVPARDEEDGINVFYNELMKYLPKVSASYEVIFVDDGSSDNTLTILKSLANKNKNVRVVSFKRNRGKADALAYGFFHANGEIIITMDADLQDKPSELHKFIDKYKEGSDVVCGWRKERKDKQKMVVISKMFNHLIGVLFGLKLHDIDCGFKLFSKEAVDKLYIYGGLYRFIPVLLYQEGYIVDEVEVEHDTRNYGKSKYGFSKVWKNLPDLFTMFFLAKYRNRPLHFFGVIGALFLIVGFIILSYLTYIHTFEHQPIYRRPILFGGILLVISGFQVFFTGFLADLMINLSFSSPGEANSPTNFPLKFSSDKNIEARHRV
jgi:glycosyltransferase involved in cell wall biosynthesis